MWIRTADEWGGTEMKKLLTLLIWLVPCGMWMSFLLMRYEIRDDIIHEIAVALSVMAAGAALLIENVIAAVCVQVFCAAVICVAAPGYIISFVPITLMICGLGLLRRSKITRAFMYADMVIQLLCFGGAVCSFAGVGRGVYSFDHFEAGRALELKYDILFLSMPILFVVMCAVCLTSEIGRKNPKFIDNKKKNSDKSGISSYPLLFSVLCVSHYVVSAIICIAFLLDFYYTDMKGSSNFHVVFLPWLVYTAVSVAEPLAKRNPF